MTWIDISQPLYNGMPVWPGDKAFHYELTWKKKVNGVVNVGQAMFSTHTGTHVDAPFHYDEDGHQIHQLEPSLFIGEAQVIYLPDREKISSSDIEKKAIYPVERLLIRTDSAIDTDSFPEKYTSLHPDVGPMCFRKGIKLIGVDVPSVDYVDSKTLDAHHSLHQNNIHILENLVLHHVEEGIYELIALPLAIVGGDGSPVRAVVRKRGR